MCFRCSEVRLWLLMALAMLLGCGLNDDAIGGACVRKNGELTCMCLPRTNPRLDANVSGEDAGKVDDDAGLDKGMDAGDSNSTGNDMRGADSDEPNTTMGDSTRSPVVASDSVRPTVECDDGQFCNPIPETDYGLCDCDSVSCHGRSECRGRQCVTPDNCGNQVPCLDGGVCDVVDDRCTPYNGNCNTQRCPQFQKMVAGAEVACVDDFCRVRFPHRAPKWLGPETTSDGRALNIVVPDPDNGTHFTTWYDVTFDWEDTNDPVLVTVLQANASNRESYIEQAFWTMSVAVSAPSKAAFVDGYIVPPVGVSEDWRQARDVLLDCSDDRFCMGGTFYVALISVRPNGVTSATPLVPFTVGESIKVPEELSQCKTDQDCQHPTRVMSCENSHCFTVCASHRDCQQSVVSDRCGSLVHGRRLCGVTQ